MGKKTWAWSIIFTVHTHRLQKFVIYVTTLTKYAFIIFNKLIINSVNYQQFKCNTKLSMKLIIPCIHVSQSIYHNYSILYIFTLYILHLYSITIIVIISSNRVSSQSLLKCPRCGTIVSRSRSSVDSIPAKKRRWILQIALYYFLIKQSWTNGTRAPSAVWSKCIFYIIFCTSVINL